MEFKISKASDWDYKDNIKLNTLEDLIKFIDNNGGRIIIEEYEDKKYEITIYDYYVE